MIRRLLNNATLDDTFNRYLSDGGDAFVSPSLRPYLLAALLEQKSPDQPALIVTGDDRTAKELAGELTSWLSPRKVRFYPSRGVTYESHLAPPPHLVGLRIAALDALVDKDEAPVIIASAVALSEKVPDPELRPKAFKLRKGDLLDLDECAQQLTSAGYERVDQVDDRGQFAMRGGLLDVFPASEDRAVRVDLFDIEIESLRYFSTFTQRSLEEIEEVEIDPCAELALQYRESAELAALEDEKREDITELLPLERFIEPLDLVPASATVLVAADEELTPALTDSWQDITATFHDREAHQLYVKPEALTADLKDRSIFTLTSVEQDRAYLFPAQAAEVGARSIQAAEPELEKQVRSNYTTLVTWPTRGEGERAGYNLGQLAAKWIDEDSEVEAKLLFAQTSLTNGFIAPQFQLAIYPHRRLLRRRREAVSPRRGRGVLRSFTDLAVGDYVVHEDHGIARFAGFETRTVVGVTRDYLYLEYQGDDRVFVPSDQLAKISRYVGAGGEAPKLSKLGGTRWEQMKARARRAAEELAGELLNLYAQRRQREGHAFELDGEWQREFEDAFPYRETPDQLEAIEQVKADMESSSPMDRLICGDVGFGKTEVALRAAFKAAADGKQVLVLVPTTILAQQHFGTFSERLRDYPFNVELVSRFQSRGEQKKALDGFAAGSVDILVGTHRVLSTDVTPKDLGLVIVDEEQRFGVKQKELLRQLKLKVDVIAMSATPIPRTLQMSLAGVRDISVIETPPEGRRPVRTFVGEYDEQLVKTAIERELDRGGQVFFMHNRVESIDETALRIRALVPQARVLVVHGQLEEEELEERMFSFLRGDGDVLVCTSIIESGLDIPQANTLLVERADTFGLSQLYQIRGRVGRGNERAYAYLLYPSANALTPEAANRLAALSDYTELGSGFKIAMRDLELRGAGNLLGDEQSGHVAALGFELYMQMLDEAVLELAEEEVATEAEPVRLDVPVDAYVPADYIPFEKAKIDVHRRIAAALDLAELGELREELADRFGPIPVPLENLIKLQEVRVKLGSVGARNVAFKGGRLAVTPIELDSKGAKALRAQLPDALYESGKSQFSLRVSDSVEDRFAAVSSAADVLIAVLSTRDKDLD